MKLTNDTTIRLLASSRYRRLLRLLTIVSCLFLFVTLFYIRRNGFFAISMNQSKPTLKSGLDDSGNENDNDLEGKFPRLVLIDKETDWEKRREEVLQWRLKYQNDTLEELCGNETMKIGDICEDDDNSTSRPLSWRFNATEPECNPSERYKTSFPTCNLIHEIDLIASPETNVQILDKGSSRIAWTLNRTIMHTSEKRDIDSIILKTSRFDREVDKNTIEYGRLDSLALEMLTFSPFVIKQYGFCSLTTLNQVAQFKIGHVFKHMKFTPIQKLHIVKDIATGLKHIHAPKGIPSSDDYNTIFVHNDINPANILYQDGIPKFHDFHLSPILPFNNRTNKTCEFPPTGFDSPQWRSPEEILSQEQLKNQNITTHVSEKIDVFSLGNILYVALTGKKPWGSNEINPYMPREEIARRKKLGVIARFPRKILQTEDVILTVIHRMALQCYTLDPKLRPSASYVAETLEGVLEIMEKEDNGNMTIEDLEKQFPLLMLDDEKI